MKKIIIICGLLVTIMSSCTKVYEDIEDEHIKRPGYDVEIPTNPSWDDKHTPQDEPIGK